MQKCQKMKTSQKTTAASSVNKETLVPPVEEGGVNSLVQQPQSDQLQLIAAPRMLQVPTHMLGQLHMPGLPPDQVQLQQLQLAQQVPRLA